MLDSPKRKALELRQIAESIGSMDEGFYGFIRAQTNQSILQMTADFEPLVEQKIRAYRSFEKLKSFALFIREDPHPFKFMLCMRLTEAIERLESEEAESREFPVSRAEFLVEELIEKSLRRINWIQK